MQRGCRGSRLLATRSSTACWPLTLCPLPPPPPLPPRTMSPPSVTLTVPPHSPARSRSVSQPIPEDAALDTLSPPRLKSSRSATLRSLSSNSVARGPVPFSQNHAHSNSPSPQFRANKGRARSSSLVTVTEVGGDDPDNVVDRLGAGNNENAAWVNAPGEFLTRKTKRVRGTSSL